MINEATLNEDESKVKTLGPYCYVLSEIVAIKRKGKKITIGNATKV